MACEFCFYECFAGEENHEVDEGKFETDFKSYKAKVYSLTVPLNLVALRGSVPPSWIKDFLSSQGKIVRLKTRFRANLEEIFFDLSKPTKNGKKESASSGAADLISIGDSWLSFAIKEKNYGGEKAPDGEMWALPYCWGSIVIAYKKSKFQNYKLAPIENWADLWQPELAGRISIVNSPRKVVGAVDKYIGASYNTTYLDSQVPGGRI